MKPEIKKVYWKDVRAKVSKVNPTLANEINKLDPSDQFPIWYAKYPFGAKILNKGRLCLPDNKGKIISIDDPDLDREIYEDLKYTPNMPIGVVLDKTIELCCFSGRQPIPYRFMMPGRVFSLWALLQEPNTSSHTGRMWQVTSGSRLVFSLSKLSNSSKFTKLKKEFGLKVSVPFGLIDQFPLLCELANNSVSGPRWYSEVIFFTESWFNKLSDPEWVFLQNCLIKMVQQDSSFLRDEIVFNYAVSRALLEKNMKPNPYLVDTVKHIFSISSSNFPGFKIADSDISAPISMFEEIIPAGCRDQVAA